MLWHCYQTHVYYYDRDHQLKSQLRDARSFNKTALSVATTASDSRARSVRKEKENEKNIFVVQIWAAMGMEKVDWCFPVDSPLIIVTIAISDGMSIKTTRNKIKGIFDDANPMLTISKDDLQI